MSNLHRICLVAFVIALGLLTAGCAEAPDEARVAEVVEQRVDQALGTDTMELSSLRRLGSGPLDAGADGKPRRIVYYNAVLTFARDLDFSSWDTLNVAAFSNLMGATQQGITGLEQDGNSAGDQVYVHGSVSFARGDDGWTPVDTLQAPVGTASPGPSGAAESRRIIEQINALLASQGEHPRQRAEIITEVLNDAYQDITLRLDRLQRALIIAGGSADGEYARVAPLLAAELTAMGAQARAVASGGSNENLRLLRAGKVDVALAQNNVAAEALLGAEPFAELGPYYDLQALASLFPEPVHVIVAADSQMTNLRDLVGKRVDIGIQGSGGRLTAMTLLAAAGIELADLSALHETGLGKGLALLEQGEVDAVISTIGAPAFALQQAAARGRIRLLPVSAEQRDAMTRESNAYVPIVLPPSTYPGQREPVPTVAVTALLTAAAGLPAADVERILTALFDRIDFIRAGSAAGSLITRQTAAVGLTIPMHPAAVAFFGGTAAAQ
jgi:TRAP transporter TAXI family solute receptor